MESCRNCVNLEDRRAIEGVAICAMHHGPSVSCAEFEPRRIKNETNRFYNRFCLKCINFENINGIPICSKDHRPGVACGAFTMKEHNTKSRKLIELRTT